MHKLIVWFFRRLDDIGQFFSVICSFFIMMTVLYWLEGLVNAQWNWLNFIKPALDVLLDFANNLFPYTFNAFGASFDAKFITTLIALIGLMILLRFLVEQLANLKGIYDDAHFAHKLAVEKSFNKNLIKKVKVEQEQISQYMVLIKTKIKKKFSHQELGINLDEQNKKMNEFIQTKTGAQHIAFNGGFLYNFDNFDTIDNVIEVLFKVLKSNAPLDYAICIQEGSDLNQLKKLAELENYEKITMSADTVLRYKFNKAHRYGTNCIGVYQKGEGTIEVHEFQEIL